MARVDTLQEAQVLARALQSGAITGPQRDVAMTALRDFQAEDDARNDFYATRLQTTPTEAPPQLQEVIGRQFASDEERAKALADDPVVAHARAAAKGVDVRSGIPAGIRAKAGLLNFNPTTATFVLDELIRANIDDNEVPRGIPRVGTVEGVNVALMQQDDGSYRYTAIDPVGLDLGDLAEFSGELPQIGAEILGGLGGAAAGAPGGVPGIVAGGTAGAAIAGQLSLDARVWLAKKVGVPEEMIDDAVTSDVRLREAMVSVLGDLATAGTLGTIRALGNLRGGRTLSAEDVERMMPEVEKSLETAAEFKTRTGRDMPLSMAQLTGDADLAVAEAQLKRRARGDSAKELKVREVEADRATNEALKDITETRTRTPRDSQRSLEEVTEDVVTGVRGEARAARERAEVAEENLDQFTRTADSLASPDAFIKVRDDAATAAERARVEEGKAWDNYRKEVEWKQGEGSNVRLESGANSPIKRALLEMDDDAGRALLESSRRSKDAFVKDAGLPDEGPTQGLAAEFLDPRELHFTLSDLKRKIRHAQKGVDPDGFRVEDMRRMVRAIEETIETAPLRRASSGREVRPEKAARVRESFKQANDLTIAGHSLYDSKNMRTLLETKTRVTPDGVVRELDMPAGLIQKRMFKEGDARFLNDALDAVDHNPATKAALAEELVKKHRNATKTDFSGDAQRRFMEDHRDHLRLLGIDPASIRGAGGLAQAARSLGQQATRVADRLARTFGKRIGDETTDVTNIAKELGNTTSAKAKNVVDFLDREAPELANELRDHSLAQVRRDLSVQGDNSLNFDSLWRTVDEQGDTLKAIHGDQYVQDLRVLKDTQRLIERKRLGKAPQGGEQQPTWLEMTRSLLGPLSKKQRFITAVQRAARRQQGNALKNVISSPDDLRRYVKLKTESPEEMAAILASDQVLRAMLVPQQQDFIESQAAALNQLTPFAQDTLRGRAGATVAPGRPSPAEAVGGPSARLSPALQEEVRGAQRPGVSQLHRHEGFRGQEYRDSVGVRTIGYGRNLEANPITQGELRDMGTTRKEIEENGLTEEQAQVLFARDYANAVRTAVRTPGWDKLNPARKDVIINMAFNLGPTRLRGFKRMMTALAAGDYDLAAEEMLDSKWAEQVGNRADELAHQMRTGAMPGG